MWPTKNLWQVACDQIFSVLGSLTDTLPQAQREGLLPLQIQAEMDLLLRSPADVQSHLCPKFRKIDTKQL
jgi:hypothetical protein